MYFLFPFRILLRSFIFYQTFLAEFIATVALPTDTPGTSTQHSTNTEAASTSVRQTATSSALPPTTTLSTSVTTPKTSSSSSTTENARTASNSPKKLKMPRVTLKLRENETIPQMYMKAGIASYKKGNITTSVLAHGLSLEGLIFKTPEGTIKPWPQKWFFSDPSADFQWKVSAPIFRSVARTFSRGREGGGRARATFERISSVLRFDKASSIAHTRIIYANIAASTFFHARLDFPYFWNLSLASRYISYG